MPDPSPPSAAPAPPVPEDTSLVVRPGFLRAWQGIWCLTWKSRSSRRALPGLAITLLALPLLAYFTLEPMKHWLRRVDWRGDARQQVNAFRASAAQAKVPLGPGLAPKLWQIIKEEQNATPPVEPAGNSADAEDGASLASQKIQQARECSERIQRRVRPLLDARQSELFQRSLARQLEQTIARLQRSGFQNQRPFYRWLIDLYFLLVLPLYCLSSCGAMIRDEVHSDLLGFLTTRPASRARLFVVKYLCQVIWLEGLAAAHALLLYAAGVLRETPGAAATLLIFLGAQFLAVLAWGALSALLGVLTRRYLLLGIAYGLLIEVGIGHIPTNINSLSLTRHLQSLLAHNPQFHQIYDWTPQNFWLAAGMPLLAVALFLAAGAVIFTVREYHHSEEMRR